MMKNLRGNIDLRKLFMDELREYESKVGTPMFDDRLWFTLNKIHGPLPDHNFYCRQNGFDCIRMGLL